MVGTGSGEGVEDDASDDAFTRLLRRFPRTDVVPFPTLVGGCTCISRALLVREKRGFAWIHMWCSWWCYVTRRFRSRLVLSVLLSTGIAVSRVVRSKNWTWRSFPFRSVFRFLGRRHQGRSRSLSFRCRCSFLPLPPESTRTCKALSRIPDSLYTCVSTRSSLSYDADGVLLGPRWCAGRGAEGTHVHVSDERVSGWKRERVRGRGRG